MKSSDQATVLRDLQARRSPRPLAHLHGCRPPRRRLLVTFPYLQEQI
jgi:hypothetical protein